MPCYMCQENDKGYFDYYCEKCSKIKRMISLYGIHRVYDILDSVLVRTPTQQAYKIEIELEKEQGIAKEKVEAIKVITRSTKKQ